MASRDSGKNTRSPRLPKVRSYPEIVLYIVDHISDLTSIIHSWLFMREDDVPPKYQELSSQDVLYFFRYMKQKGIFTEENPEPLIEDLGKLQMYSLQRDVRTMFADLHAQRLQTSTSSKAAAYPAISELSVAGSLKSTETSPYDAQHPQVLAVPPSSQQSNLSARKRPIAGQSGNVQSNLDILQNQKPCIGHPEDEPSIRSPTSLRRKDGGGQGGHSANYLTSLKSQGLEHPVDDPSIEMGKFEASEGSWPALAVAQKLSEEKAKKEEEEAKIEYDPATGIEKALYVKIVNFPETLSTYEHEQMKTQVFQHLQKKANPMKKNRFELPLESSGASGGGGGRMQTTEQDWREETLMMTNTLLGDPEVHVDQDGRLANEDDDAPGNPEGDGSDSDEDSNPVSSLLVPPAILARGLRAQQAYAEAARVGTKKVFRTRLMLVGQERAGKTSLKKSLTGQGFDENEPITDGVETSNACEINVEVAKTGGMIWSIHREENENLDTKGDKYSKALAEEIAKKLIVTTQDPGGAEAEPESIHTGGKPSVLTDRCISQTTTKGSGSVEPDPDRRPTEGGTSVNQAEQTEAARKVDDRLPTYLASLVENSLKKQVRTKERGTDVTDGGKEDRLSLSIWDFAGHDVYYTTHQVFLSWRAVYAIVFDLSRSLDSVVPPECRGREYEKAKGGKNTDLTCLEFINFWLCSIFTHAVAPSSVTNKNTGKATQKSPPIFIVGTHRDSIKGNPREKKNKIDSAFDAIRKTIKKKPFECHVIPKFYAIENSLDDNDKELIALREHIEKVAIKEPYMGEEIPLRWLKFEEALAAGKSNYMSLDQTKELTRPVGIDSENELLTMLTFYHDLGYIVYYGDIVEHQSLLRDIVILNPQWLIDVFKQVITLPDPEEREGIVSDAWSSLEEDGILEEHLIQHMWQGFLEKKEALLELMAKFDLICDYPVQQPKQQDQDKNGDEVSEVSELPEVVVEKGYYVPSRLMSPFPKEEMVHIKDSTDFYVDFKGFLPDGLFHRLMTRAVVWMGKQKYGQPVNLYHRHISLMADGEHWTLLKMLPPREAMIKVTVFRPDVSEYDEEYASSGQRTPDPNAVKEVMDFVTGTLKSLRLHWAKRIKYDLCFPCQTCGEKKLFKECSNKSIIQCGLHAIPITWIKSKYGPVTGVDSCSKGPMQDSRSVTKESGILSDIHLSNLAEQIGFEWLRLGIRLGLKQAAIDHIIEDKPTAMDRRLAMLQLWRQRSSSGVDEGQMIEDLCKALNRCGRSDLEEMIREDAAIYPAINTAFQQLHVSESSPSELSGAGSLKSTETSPYEDGQLQEVAVHPSNQQSNRHVSARKRPMGCQSGNVPSDTDISLSQKPCIGHHVDEPSIRSPTSLSSKVGGGHGDHTANYVTALQSLGLEHPLDDPSIVLVTSIPDGPQKQAGFAAKQPPVETEVPTRESLPSDLSGAGSFKSTETVSSQNERPQYPRIELPEDEPSVRSTTPVSSKVGDGQDEGKHSAKDVTAKQSQSLENHVDDPAIDPQVPSRGIPDGQALSTDKPISHLTKATETLSTTNLSAPSSLRSTETDSVTGSEASGQNMPYLEDLPRGYTVNIHQDNRIALQPETSQAYNERQSSRNESEAPGQHMPSPSEDLPRGSTVNIHQDNRIAPRQHQMSQPRNEQQSSAIRSEAPGQHMPSPSEDFPRGSTVNIHQDNRIGALQHQMSQPRNEQQSSTIESEASGQHMPSPSEDLPRGSTVNIHQDNRIGALPGMIFLRGSTDFRRF